MNKQIFRKMFAQDEIKSKYLCPNTKTELSDQYLDSY